MNFIVDNAIKGTHDFMWAVARMKDGKKIKTEKYNDMHLYMLEGDDSICHSKTHRELSKGHLINHIIEGLDWEIYEEEDNWNLADHKDSDGSFFPSEVKTFIQKVKEDIDKCIDETNTIGERATKITMKRVIDKRAGDLK